MADEIFKTVTPLTAEETILVREIIEDQKRWKWLASGMRTSASWVAIVLGTLFLMWDRVAAWAKGGISN